MWSEAWDQGFAIGHRLTARKLSLLKLHAVPVRSICGIPSGVRFNCLVLQPERFGIFRASPPLCAKSLHCQPKPKNHLAPPPIQRVHLPHMTMSRTQLTPDLFFDLIDRRLTAIDICSRHQLSFDQLEAVVQSPAFQDAAARLKSVEQTRCTATDTLRRTAALRTLEDIAAQHPSCPTHSETIRLAAAQILRVTHADPIADQQTPHQPDLDPDPDPDLDLDLDSEFDPEHQPDLQPDIQPDLQTNRQPDPPAPHQPAPKPTTANHAPHPEPTTTSDWPDDTGPQTTPTTTHQTGAPHPAPTSKATPTTTARDLISRAGASEPINPASTTTRVDAKPAPTSSSAHKRAPPPQHAA